LALRDRALLAGALALAGLLAARPAEARRVRRHFQPTDLELEEPGSLSLDLEAGFVRGPDAMRAALPDAEIELGLSPAFEIDIDAAFWLEGPGDGTRAFDRLTLDNLWLGGKVGLWTEQDEDAASGMALGLQAGPKLPLAPGTHGLGFEGVLLLTLHQGKTYFTFNGGGLVDPAGDSGERPLAIEGGLDFDRELGEAGRWSAAAAVGALHFFSSDGDQINLSAGLTFTVSDRLELSLIVLSGLLAGSDRYGVLVGVSPSARLWQ
jgi:hypothetical protein